MPTVSRAIMMIHPGGLGDVLLAVPAMIRLRARYPNHRIMLCAEDQVATLLLACGIVDAWTSIQGRDCTELFVGGDSMTDRVRTWLVDCDLAIGLTNDPDGTLNETLKAIGVREVIVRSPFSAQIQAAHQSDRFLEAIHEAPFVDGGDPLLKVTEPLIQRGRARLEATGLSRGQSLVVIHPGSGSTSKCVAPEILSTVIRTLQMSDMTPVVLEGPADRKQVERLLQSCLNSPIVLRDLDLLVVAGVIAHARLFFGQDSGITHMAGLIGIPTIALFGPTDPARWAPRGTHVIVVRGAPCLCQSWEEVSLCRDKPCLNMLQDNLVALCRTQLEEAAIQRRIPSSRLVTDFPVC